MAELLAKIIDNIINKNNLGSKDLLDDSIAKKYQIIAKGNANIVWLNFIKEK